VKYRQLGTSGLAVSEIGFGAWGIGGATPGATSYGVTNDKTSLAALESALVAGINFFDTSNVYGHGHSERLIGQAFSHRRNKVVIATKAGFVDYQRNPDFSANAITKSIASSLERLNTDYIDLLQLHNPSADWLKLNPETLIELSRLQGDGKIRAVGISVKRPEEAFGLLELFPFQSVQANFNMLDIRVVTSGLMEKLSDLGIGLIARTPLAFGFLAGVLTGDEIFPPEDHRSRWPREQFKLWAGGAIDLLACCKESFESPAYEVALRFCLSYPEVSTTIAGMLTPNEVASNVLATQAGSLSLQSLAQIQALHQKRHFLLS
jgi:aryl-alcohol dehydrogenase-like predicted oxidoreductase